MRGNHSPKLCFGEEHCTRQPSSYLLGFHLLVNILPGYFIHSHGLTTTYTLMISNLYLQGDLLVKPQTAQFRFYITSVTSTRRKVNLSHYLLSSFYTTDPYSSCHNKITLQIKNANSFESSFSQSVDHIVPAVSSSERNQAVTAMCKVSLRLQSQGWREEAYLRQISEISNPSMWQDKTKGQSNYMIFSYIPRSRWTADYRLADILSIVRFQIFLETRRICRQLGRYPFGVATASKSSS